MIRLEGVGKTYHTGKVAVSVLKEIFLDIQEGEYISIMGPSGSGKSTLMNLIGCLDQPTAGSYYLKGKLVSEADENELAQIRNKWIGFVFQNFHLLPRMSAQLNVELPLTYAGLSKKQRERQAAEALRKVGLGNRRHHRPSELSGGQQQRVAIARALVNDPHLLLADEPTGALDTSSGAQVLNLFDELHREGRTVVMITHDQEVAERAQRQVVVRDGRIIRDSIPSGGKEGGSVTLLDNFKMALDSIRAHKMRAVLTILGIVIGVASVLIIVAIGQGGTEELTKSLAGVGNTVQVMASEEAMTKHAGGVPPDFFTEEDVRDLANLPGVKQVTSSSYDMLDVGYRKKESEGALVTGVNHNSFDQKVAQGRDFQTADFLRGHSGAVINDKMKQELFSKENPVGKIVRVGSQPVEVIGVLEGSQGMAASFDQATVYLPYQTWRSVLGKSQINQLTIQVESADRIKEVGDASIQTLERNHQTKGEYEVINMDQLVKGNNQIADIMTVVIGSIGGISLLVGGIGVMNIMLVSVTERTREIGIRMSLGATRNQIMTQFLIESVTLSIFGGVAGVLLGFGVIGLLALLSPLPAVISPMVTLGTLLFSGLFGVIFGLLPANKASRLNPIECLRYE